MKNRLFGKLFNLSFFCSNYYYLINGYILNIQTEASKECK